MVDDTFESFSGVTCVTLEVAIVQQELPTEQESSNDAWEGGDKLSNAMGAAIQSEAVVMALVCCLLFVVCSASTVCCYSG